MNGPVEVGRKRHIGGTLFGLVFFSVAVGFLVFDVLPNLYDWLRMRDWQPVAAQLISSNLESHRGDGSTTYRVVGEYRYIIAGREYSGRRIGINDGGSDNIGDWHQISHQALQQQPLQVWFNPSDPAEAVFDRDLRWGLLGFKLIFVVVFGVVGGGIIWAMGRQSAEVPVGMPLWQWEPRWRDNRIRSNAKGEMGFLWGLAIFWNAISSPPLFAIPEELSKGNYGILVVLLFTAVGLGLVYYALKKTLEWRRFGVTELMLDPFPGSIGGDVGGAVELALSASQDSKFSAELTCQHVYTRRSGNKSETRRSVVWQDQQQIRLEPGMRGARLRFCFEVPAGLPQSESASSNYHEWQLHLSGDLPGVDLERTFDIPVFALDQPQRSRLPVDREAPRPAPEIPTGVMQMETMEDGLELYYPPLRSAGIAAMLLLFGLGFGGMGGYFLLADLRNGPPAFMMAIFAGVGSLMLLGGLYKLGNSLRVRVTPRGLQVVRRVYGLSFESRVSAQEIQSIEKRVGWQQQRGTRTKVMYQVQAIKRNGATISLGDSLPNAGAAEQVVAAIRQALALEVSTPERVGALVQPDLLPAELLDRGRRIMRYIKIGANLVALGVFVYFLLDFGLLDQVKKLFS